MKYAKLPYTDENSRHRISPDEAYNDYVILKTADMGLQIPNDISAVLNSLPYYAVISGSAAMACVDNSIAYSDIDVFMMTRARPEGISRYLSDIRSIPVFANATIEYVNKPMGTLLKHGLELSSSDSNLYSIYAPKINKTIQLIKSPAMTPQEVIHAFDYVAPKVALCADGVAIVHKNAIAEIKSKTLSISCKYTDGPALMRRLVKYMGKGFTPNLSFYHDAGIAINNSYVSTNNEVFKKSDDLY